MGTRNTQTHTRAPSQQGGDEVEALDAAGGGNERAGDGEGRQEEDDNLDSSLDLHTLLPCVLFFYLQNRL
jgi:hypothetical protein